MKGKGLKNIIKTIKNFKRKEILKEILYFLPTIVSWIPFYNDLLLYSY